MTGQARIDISPLSGGLARGDRYYSIKRSYFFTFIFFLSKSSEKDNGSPIAGIGFDTSPDVRMIPGS